MQRTSVDKDWKEERTISGLEARAEQLNIRIGAYFSELDPKQKQRFTRIVNHISKRFKLKAYDNPLEYILIRQIALNSIRIEKTEKKLLEDENYAHDDKLEKWLLGIQAERRNAMETLWTLIKTNRKKGDVEKFGDMRDYLREAEGLPKSEIVVSPDGHDRRFKSDGTTDGVTRIAK